MARAEAGYAAVAFQPTAHLPDPPAAPGDSAVTQVREIRDRAAGARAAATTAAAFLVELAAGRDDGPIAPDLATAVWPVLVQATGRHGVEKAPFLAIRLFPQAGEPAPAVAPERLYAGWTAGRLRAALDTLSREPGSRPAGEVVAAAADRLRRDARRFVDDAAAHDAGADRLQGERAAARVRAALAAAAPALQGLDLVSRYERSQGAQLERTLRMFFALQTVGGESFEDRGEGGPDTPLPQLRPRSTPTDVDSNPDR